MAFWKVRNFSWTQDGVIAGCGCPYRKGNIQELWDKGVRSIVSLTENSLDYEMEKNLDDAELDASRQALAQMRYLHSPINDSTNAPPEQLEEICAFIKENQAQGLPVVVHCAAGKGRTGQVLASYMVSNGMTADEALELLKEKRGDLENHAQREAVRKYQFRRSQLNLAVTQEEPAASAAALEEGTAADPPAKEGKAFTSTDEPPAES